MRDPLPEMRRLAADAVGAVMVESAAILSVVAVGCALATVALGGPLVRMFVVHETWLPSPDP